MSEQKPWTQGINHVGVAVQDLRSSTRFFTEILGWAESGRDESYPRTLVSDGRIRLTLWQVDRSLEVQPFHRRKNVGLHHLALEVASAEKLNALADLLRLQPDVKIELPPELLSGGPPKHMMCSEPGGIRIEFTWPGT